MSNEHLLRNVLTTFFGATFALASFGGDPTGSVALSSSAIQPQPSSTMQDPTTTDTITLGAGCFWCVEAVFTELKGVKSVMPGYTGGQTLEPDYKSVCSGTTGHAEVAQVIFDPRVITVDELLEVFWQTHDPTTLNRQGHDVGTQYRSAIFFHSTEQRDKALRYKAELDKSGAFAGPIVTEVTAIGTFYPAENYHRDYYANNPDQGYCQYVIRPKVEKLRKVFANKLK
jgi:peptide-methionine (S)-S-oxide reductase